MAKLSRYGLLLVILWLFSAGSPALAGDFSILSISGLYSPLTFYNIPTADYLGQIFYTNNNYRVASTSISVYWAFDGSFSNIIEAGIWDLSGGLIATSTATITRITNTTAIFVWPSGTNISEGFYFLGIKNISASPGSSAVYRGTIGGGDYDGGCKINYSGSGSISFCSGADIFMTITARFTPQIAIVFPATSTPDFSAWYISSNTPATSTWLGSVIQYSRDPALASCSGLYSGSKTSGTFTCFADQEPLNYNSTSSPVLKLNNLNPGAWYARPLIVYTTLIPAGVPPYLPTATTTILSTGEIISFNVLEGEKIANFTEFIPVSPANVSSSVWTLNCDPSMGVIGESFCNMLGFAIIPSEASLNSLTGIKDLVILKPPLGYFTQINSFLSLGFTTSSSAIDLTALAPLTLTGGLFWYLKAGLSWLLWALFGFWVFKKFRHFQL